MTILLRKPLVGLLILLLAALAWRLWPAETPRPLRIGILHALSGPMAGSERGLVQAAQLAVEEINADGGLLGRTLEMVVADSRSDWSHAAREAARLLDEEEIDTLFACWTSSCRQAVRPQVEARQALMFYPLQYEGMEQSPQLVYLGAAPNQQIIPGTRWAMQHFGGRVYLIGSDYLFPRAANQLIRDLVELHGGRVLGERYVPMEATEFASIAAEIEHLGADVILNTINGAANQHFFAALARHPVRPVVSFSIAEPELQQLPKESFHPAHYAVWGYFQSLDDPVNHRFVARFRARFGPAQPVSDPVVSSYEAVQLWARAVREAGTARPAHLQRALHRVSLVGPSGIVALDASTRHRWRSVHVGRARPDGQFMVLERISETPVRPSPFPPQRSLEEWRQLVERIGHGGVPAHREAR